MSKIILPYQVVAILSRLKLKLKQPCTGSVKRRPGRHSVALS